MSMTRTDALQQLGRGMRKFEAHTAGQVLAAEWPGLRGLDAADLAYFRRHADLPAEEVAQLCLRRSRGHDPLIATDLCAGLPEATPEAIRALREGASLSLAGVAELLAIGDRGTWARWERGERAMPAQTWSLALLALGQHPHYRVARTPARAPTKG